VSGFPIIKAANLKNGCIDWKNIAYTSTQPPDSARVKTDDIALLSAAHQSSYLGKNPCLIDLADMNSNDVYCVGEVFIFRPLLSKILPKYLQGILDTNLTGLMIRREVRGQSSHLYPKDINQLLIPLPPLAIQHRLVAELDAARAERDEALAEAEILLKSIDKMVKQKLGLPDLEPPRQSSYAIRLSTAKTGNTLSADYFHPERMQAIRSIQCLPNAPLSKLVSFKRDFIKSPGDARYIGLASVASGSGQLTDATETASGQCFTFSSGDVLYGRLRPYLNKVWLATFDGVSSTEFHVMRPFDVDTLRPEYLAVVMRTSLIVAQTKHMMTGNTHPRIANEDVANLFIPLTDGATQAVIVSETLARQAEVSRLCTHAETVWREARERFEQQLLHGEKT
jgi:hypothetical protein